MLLIAKKKREKKRDIIALSLGVNSIRVTTCNHGNTKS